MSAYAYNADLYCEECGREFCKDLKEHKDSGDSEEYPQYVLDGGGEADTPQHCGACGEFLENPLTAEGWDCVIQAILEYMERGWGLRDVIETWIDFYDVSITDLLNHGDNKRKGKA